MVPGLCCYPDFSLGTVHGLLIAEQCKEPLLLQSMGSRGASQVALVVKNLPSSAGNIRDMGSIPGLGKPPGGFGNPLQYSCLENPMGRGAWWASVHGVSKSWTAT